jgi:hypothetical protein
MDQNCGNCRFFDLKDKNTGAGECRRYPPTVLAGEWMTRPSLSVTGPPNALTNQVMNIAGQNPPTMRNLWCGEWDEMPKSREEADA